jgi:outer membrane protein assembly factor BamA
VRPVHTLVLSAVALVLLLGPSPSAAQDLGGGGGAGGRIEGRYKIVPLPYINYNRSLGFTLGALPMVMFNPVAADTLSPSSIAGALAMYTTNETWFLMGFTQMFFAEDTWRFTGAGGTGSVNFQFYLDNPVGGWVPYNTAADFAYVELQRRVVKRIYAGASYIYTNFRNTTEAFPIEDTVTLHGLGLKATMDTRTNVYYPKSGFFTNVQYFTYPEAFGNETTSQQVDIDYNHYWPFRKDQDVLAARGFVGLGIGDLAFNQQYIVGKIDIRGYTQGAYRGNYLVAAQTEYRWNFWGRWGAVGFFGLATVFDAINEADNGKILPGIGCGIRFTAFKEGHMNVGLDVAAGRGDWGMYFRIGEAL